MSFQRITTIGSIPLEKSEATASREIRSPSFSSRWISIQYLSRSLKSRQVLEPGGELLAGTDQHLGQRLRLRHRRLDLVEAEEVGGLLGEVDDVVHLGRQAVDVLAVDRRDEGRVEPLDDVVGDPVALLLGLEDLPRRGRPSSGQVPIIWSSSRAACRVFWPASMKRSKKVRSRGSREKRATRPILLVRRWPRRNVSRRPRPDARRRARRSARAAPPGRCAARPRAGEPGPDAVGVELPGVGVVGEAALEHVEQLGLQLRVLDRRDQLDPAVEVARHQVGGAHQNPRLLAALEGVDARVLEEAADDRDDADVLRDPRHPGPQAADARAR